MKKIVLIGIAFFVLAIGLGWYIIFKRPIQQEQPTDNLGVNTPFGSEAGNSPVATSSTDIATQGTNVQLAELSHLYNDPIAGATFISTKAGTTTGVRLTERATGHIYDVSLSSGLLSRVSNTTIPKIYQSLWLSGGSTTILRYIKSTNNIPDAIASYSARLVALKASSTSPDVSATLQGNFLPENIVSIAGNPGGNKIFYIVSTPAGSQGVTASADGTKKGTIFSSAITEWVTSWPNESTITLSTKPSAGTAGYMYFLTTGGSVRKVLDKIVGLVALTNPQATLVATSDSLLNLEIRDVRTGKVVPTHLKTLAEKCVWSTKLKDTLYCAVPGAITASSYPDSWYQGLISFSDQIYQINATTGTTKIVGELKTKYNQDIDAIDLHISTRGDYISFTNKKDLSLWVLALPLATTTPLR